MAHRSSEDSDPTQESEGLRVSACALGSDAEQDCALRVQIGLAARHRHGPLAASKMQPCGGNVLPDQPCCRRVQGDLVVRFTGAGELTAARSHRINDGAVPIATSTSANGQPTGVELPQALSCSERHCLRATEGEYFSHESPR